MTKRPFIAVLFLVASLPLAASPDVTISKSIGQPAMVFTAQDVRDRTLPMRVHVRGAPLVFSSEVILACIGVRFRQDDLLVYLPESHSCQTLESLSRSSPEDDSGLKELADPGRKRTRLMQQVERSGVAVYVPATVAGACTCPGNLPPVVTVESGSPQEVVAGGAIATIEYLGTDVDSEVLFETFSYTHNGGSKQNGLPVGLEDDCSHTSGTVNCDVTGTAPLITGQYLIRLDVSDGLALGTAVASLSVVSPVLDFADGFENLDIRD